MSATATATKSSPRTPTPAELAAEADAAVTAADAAAQAAHQATTDARAALAAAEAELLDAVADGAARPQIEKIRERVDLAKKEVGYADLDAEAAEVRYSRTADAAAAAHRALVRQEYAAAHAAYNDPNNREEVLLDQLQSVVAELCRLIDKRQTQHDRLAREYASFPDAERFPVRPGRQITTYGHRGQGRWELDVPNAEVAEAIKAGVIAAKSGGN